MFKKYGILGIILIILVELNFLFKIEPFASKYFIIVWLGYILTIDALNYKIKKKSLIMNYRLIFVMLFLFSSIFWWIFELFNLRIGNWSYNGLKGLIALNHTVWKTIYFSTVLPAFFETYELFRNFNLFNNLKLKKKHNISKTIILTMLSIGIISFILPLLYPKYFFPLVWVTFFFILDPINYLHKEPSVIGHIKNKELKELFSLILTGIILGFFWEFWNYWAITKWHYNIPFIGFFKIFEMPILGYLGYIPFALELYAMYWFVMSLIKHKKHILE